MCFTIGIKWKKFEAIRGADQSMELQSVTVNAKERREGGGGKYCRHLPPATAGSLSNG
jgi:hypothetical protein